MVALHTAIAGVAAFVEDQHRAADSLFEQALRKDPSLRIGNDDFSARVAQAFSNISSRLVFIRRVSMSAHGLINLEPTIQAGPDTVRFLTTIDRPALVTLRILALRRVDTIWRDSALVDSVASLPWNGRARQGPPRPLPSGPYILEVSARGNAASDSHYHEIAPLAVQSTLPAMVSDLGPIPDSALVKEARGNGVKAGSVIKGLTFGGLAFGVAAASSANWNGPGGGGRVALVAAPAVILGIIGAIVAKPGALDPARVAENARRRLLWEQQRRVIAESNARTIAGPYVLHLRLQP